MILGVCVWGGVVSLSNPRFSGPFTFLVPHHSHSNRCPEVGCLPVESPGGRGWQAAECRQNEVGELQH